MSTISLKTVINQHLRAQKKTTQSLSDYLGMSRVNLNTMLNNKRLAFEHLEKVAEYLNIPLPELLVPVFYSTNEAKIISGIIGEIRDKIHSTPAQSIQIKS